MQLRRVSRRYTEEGSDEIQRKAPVYHAQLAVLLAVCFWSASFRIPPSIRLFDTGVRRFEASIGLHRILDACVFKSFIFLYCVFSPGLVFAWWSCVSALGSAHGFAVPYIRTLVFVVTAHFARLIASTMLEHARDLAPSSINLHACAGLVAYLVRSFLGGLLAKVSCCSPSLKFDVLIGHDTQILSSTIFISSLHSHPKTLKGMPPPQLKILLFSPLHHKKGKMLPQRGQERQEFGQGQGWPWVKGKVMIGKVDRTRLSPFRLVLGWVFNFSPYPAFLACLAPARRHLGRSGGWAFSFVFLLYIHVIVVWPLLSRRNGSLSSSPPFRLALAWSPPPSITTLVGARCILTVQLTTIEGGHGFASSHPLRLALDWELFFFLLLSPLLFYLLSGRPARWNPKWFRSKVIILLLFLRRLLPWKGPKWSALSKFEEGPWVSLVRSPSTLPVLVVLALEPPFSSSYLMLLFTQTTLIEESLVSFFSPPFSLLPKSVWVAFWRHYSLFFPIFLSSMCCSFLPSSSWADTACTGDDFRDAYSLGATDCVSAFPPFGHLFYSGLAGPRYLLEKNFWEESECRLAACPRPLFHAVSPSPGLVKLPCALQSTGMR